MNRLIIDVREPYQYESNHVNGAINIPPKKIMAGLPDELIGVPKDTEIILYCLSGSRSHAAKYILEQYGFSNLINGVNKSQVEARYF